MKRGKAKKIKSNSSTVVDQASECPVLTANTRLAGSEEDSELEQENMTELQTVLREIKEFRQEHADTFKELREDIVKTNARVEEAEQRIMESEERIQNIEDATLELLKLQRQFMDKLTDQEGRSRRENIRIHNVKEEAEVGAKSMIAFIERLLKENLELEPSLDLCIERAHRAGVAKPPEDATPRSIVVKLLSYRNKEEIIKAAWQRKGFMFEGRKIIIDHDYAPEVLKQRKEYAEAKRVLKEKKIRFQTPFPAKLQVFYDGGTKVYNTATEATKDMAARGYEVTIVKPAEDVFEKVRRLTWREGRAPRSQAEERPGYKQKLNIFRRSPPGHDD